MVLVASEVKCFVDLSFSSWGGRVFTRRFWTKLDQFRALRGGLNGKFQAPPSDVCWVAAAMNGLPPLRLAGVWIRPGLCQDANDLSSGNALKTLVHNLQWPVLCCFRRERLCDRLMTSIRQWTRSYRESV